MVSATFESVLAGFAQINRYHRDRKVAPHKPLVMLHALGELQRGQITVGFPNTEKAVAPLLADFWTADGPHRVEQPFVRLASDGFWELAFARGDAETASGAISVAWLREHDARAGFDPPTLAVLQADPRRIAWAASILLLDICPAQEPFKICSQFGLHLSL